MRKTLPVYLLLLFLLAGCAAGYPVLGSPAPAASASAAGSSETAPPVPSTSPSEAPASTPSTAPAVEIAAPVPSATPSAPAHAPVFASATPAFSLALTEKLDGIFSGCKDFYGSVLIALDGKVVLQKGYGFSDAARGVKNTANSTFLIGSVTKQFTAVAVLQLYEKGLLDIRDRLSKYIPDFSSGGDITLSHLLTQTSGLADYMNDEPTVLSQLPIASLSRQKILDRVKTLPLKFAPGSRYSYSNTNYLILGYIVEKVSGLGYGAYLEKNILSPLGMRDTGVFDMAHPPERMVSGYADAGTPFPYYTPEGDIIPENARATAGSYGAGCLYSTVYDLYLWDRALSTEKLLSQKYLNMMFTPAVPIPNPDVRWSYGFGWVIENEPGGRTVYRHTGVLGGFRAYNGLLPGGAVVIMLMNNSDFPGKDKLLPAVRQALDAP